MIEFPKFRDGRGFSWARMLRTRLGFTGEVRAVGDFLYDQIAYLHRIGFDAFEVPDGFTLENFNRALARDDRRLSAQRRRQENHPRAAGARSNAVTMTSPLWRGSTPEQSSGVGWGDAHAKEVGAGRHRACADSAKSPNRC